MTQLFWFNVTSYLLLPLDKQYNESFQILVPDNLIWGNVISADTIVNDELFSAGMTSSGARLNIRSNMVCFVKFCPVLLKKSQTHWDQDLCKTHNWFVILIYCYKCVFQLSAVSLKATFIVIWNAWGVRNIKIYDHLKNFEK